MTSLDEYVKAQKLGLKEMPITGNCALPVLDELLKGVKTEGEEKLGLQSIPIDQIAGTKTMGRTNAFAPNFMPVLDYHSEFAIKWIALCDAHLEEGIRDPIIAYEYMNKYYVAEGNKRVSVLKYFGAATVSGYVTRIVPEKNDELSHVIYYEYMQFNKYSHVNYITFSQKGSYAKLLLAVGKKAEEEWTDDEQTNLRSAYVRFSKAYVSKRQTNKLNITIGDAFLAFITIYGYDDILDKLPNEIKEDIPKIWEEFLMLDEAESVQLMLNPDSSTQPKSPGLITNIFAKTTKTKIAFVHSKSAETSSWTYSHELGRMYLEQAFPNEIETCHVDNADPDNAEDIMEQLLKKGYNIIFTTTPNLVAPSLRIAVEHPDAKVLNCSLNMSHRYIRTYYARMYEAKFISGAIAGALTDTDNLGYICSYPIYGMTANINAFALGAKMTNPRVKVHLAWSCLKDKDIYQTFHDKNISHISEQDMITPNMHSKAYGLIRFESDGELKNICTTIWDWGKLYEKIVQSILNGGWKKDSVDGTKAVNYWWGMPSDVVDVILSREVSSDTRRLINLLKKAIRTGEFNPFSGVLTAQDGVIISDSEDSVLSPEEIMKMNWLNENVIGRIPTMDELLEETQKLIELQGIVEE